MKLVKYTSLISLLCAFDLAANCIAEGQPDHGDSLSYLSNIKYQVESLNSDLSIANFEQLQLMSSATFKYIKSVHQVQLANCDIAIYLRDDWQQIESLERKSKNMNKACSDYAQMLLVSLKVNKISQNYDGASVVTMLDVIDSLEL